MSVVQHTHIGIAGGACIRVQVVPGERFEPVRVALEHDGWRCEEDMTVEQARELARALTAAARECSEGIDFSGFFEGARMEQGS